MELKLASFNVRGLNMPHKILILKELLEINKIDICMIQETHLDNPKGVQCVKDVLSNYECVCPPSENKTKGVCILYKKSLMLESTNNFAFHENRIVCLDFKFKNRVYNFINIYTPNTYQEQVEFIEVLYSYCLGKKNIILAGDFNCDFVSNKKTHANIINEWKKLALNFNLERIEKNEVNYTWSSGTSKTYIDFFFVSKCKKRNQNKAISLNQPTTLSDHNFLVYTFKICSNETNSIYKTFLPWKLNESVLEDKKVDEYIKNKCKFIPQMAYEYRSEWYEKFTEDIIKMLKRESRRVSSEKKAYIKILYTELLYCKMQEENKENSEVISECEKEIETYYNNLRKGLEKRACESKRNFIFQPSKILIEKHTKNVKNNSIEKFECQDKSITENNDTIMKEIENFYEVKLGKEKVNVNQIDSYQFMLKPLDQIAPNINISQNITYAEAYGCVMSMKESAPGPNGLTIGFFKKYFPYFGESFVNLLNDTKTALSNTFNQTYIRLIPKNSDKIKNINGLRPISLTNLEYRIFTKIPTKRMNDISYMLVGDHQTCSISGRRMNDNINILKDLMNDVNVKNIHRKHIKKVL